MTLSPDFDLGPDRNLDTGIDPDRDLLIERVIRAPKEAIWSAWTEPAQLVQWWIPTRSSSASTPSTCVPAAPSSPA